MIVTLSFGNIIGCAACLLFSLLAFTGFKMNVSLVKPKENPNDLLGHMLIFVFLATSIVFALIPIGFFVVAYLERNLHILDFLIFK